MTPEPRQRRKQARPAELIAAAYELFVARGFAATRMEDIATRAGVSKGTIFLYFESKQALLRAVVEDAVLPHLRAGEALVEGAQDEPADLLLRRVLLRFANVMREEHICGLPKLINAEAGNFPALAAYYHDNVVIRVRRLIAGVIERGVADGVFRSCDPVLVGRLAVAPLLFDCMWRQSPAPCAGEGSAWDALLEAHLDIFIRGLLINPPTPAGGE